MAPDFKQSFVPQYHRAILPTIADASIQHSDRQEK